MNEEHPAGPGSPGGLSRFETIAAAVYLPVHVLGLPLLFTLPVFTPLFEDGGALMNVLYYAVGFVLLLILLHKFFRRDFDTLLDNVRVSLRSVAGCYLLSFALSLGLSLVLSALGVTLGEAPNDEAVIQVVAIDRNRMLVAVVLLAPLVEETLFRGLLFGSLLRRNRVAAYAVSMLAFAAYHVWQYAVVDPRYLIYVLAYLPVSYALCLCYERSGSIWAPIALHMLNNALSLEATMALL